MRLNQALYVCVTIVMQCTFFGVLFAIFSPGWATTTTTTTGRLLGLEIRVKCLLAEHVRIYYAELNIVISEIKPAASSLSIANPTLYRR